MPITPSKQLTEVIELSAFFRKLAPKKVLSRFLSSQERAFRIFRSIGEIGRAMHDAEVARHAGLTVRPYQRGLSELKAALLDAILDFDLKKGGFSRFSQRLHKLELANARVHVLERLGAAYSANAEASAWFEEALALEKWDTALLLLKPLMNWAALSGDVKTYDKLHRDRARIRALQQAFEEAREAEDRVTIVFAKSGAEHPELRPMIDAAIERLLPVMREHETFTLQEVALRLRKKAQQVVTNYGEALAICEDMDALLNTYPLFDHKARRSRNALSRILCYLQLKHYDRAHVELHSTQQNFDAETQNWYTCEQWRYMLAMRENQFEEAYSIVQDVKHRARFGSQSASTQDRWHLFELYSEFFSARQLPDQNLIRLFPSFAKDYSGFRMSAVILELLILLQIKDKTALVGRFESLDKYKSRHLRKTAPTRLFINMCHLMIRYDFEKSRIEPRAARYLKAIVESVEGDPIMECQVRHYEQIWGHFMDALPEVGKLFPDPPDEPDEEKSPTKKKRGVVRRGAGSRASNYEL